MIRLLSDAQAERSKPQIPPIVHDFEFSRVSFIDIRQLEDIETQFESPIATP